jgi:hypothetical protein
MNPDPDGARHARTRSKRATGNWWAIAESVRPGAYTTFIGMTIVPVLLWRSPVAER